MNRARRKKRESDVLRSRARNDEPKCGETVTTQWFECRTGLRRYGEVN